MSKEEDKRDKFCSFSAGWPRQTSSVVLLFHTNMKLKPPLPRKQVGVCKYICPNRLVPHAHEQEHRHI